MKRSGRICLAVVMLHLITAFAFAGSPQDITVSAAISLKNAFDEIGRLYQMQTGKNCRLNFGASGDLLKQIAGGAPVDVFASAAQKDMDDAAKQGLIVVATRVDFATNRIVLIVSAGSSTALCSFEGLSSAEIQKIAIGNPKTVPAGRYAAEVLAFYQVLPLIKDKSIYTENVRQVLDYVARGEVDAGIVYATDAAVRSKEIRIIATAPEASHKPVFYPIAVVRGTKSETAAKAFISLVLSPEGGNILQKYGFKSNQ